jgi:flagellar hook-associated protein 2
MAITPATTIPVSSGSISSTGIGSGLNVSDIVSKLMAVESQPLTAFDTKEASYQAKISAYGSIKSALASFQSSLSGLLDPNAYGAFAASVGDSGVLAATAGSGASAGNYSVEVTQLAQAQKLASSGFANTTDPVGTGTLTFSFGTFGGSTFTPNGNGTKTVNIGAGQNTLAGVRDAVNAAGVGVTATIVNDGSAAGNHLVFTSTASGSANSIKLTVADDDGSNANTSGLSQLAYDPAAALGSGRNLVQNVAAQNALLNIDGIAVSKASNSITDAIQGVTLNITKTNAGTPTTVSVSQSTASVVTAVQAFVKAYNEVNTTLVSLTKYDPSTQKAAVLTGDSTGRLVQSQLRNIISHSLASGTAGTLSTLSQVGVSLQQDGTLSLDTGALNSALASNRSGVASLFAAVGQASDSLTTVTGGTANTKAGTYALNITQVATQGKLAGSAPAGLTITAGINDQLAVSVDGVAATITLAAGTYANASALAAEVQSDINGGTAIANNGSSVAVTAVGGVLTIASTRYGSVSKVTASGNAASPLLGGVSTTSNGVDVAGTIGGVPGLGSGQNLTGPSGSAVAGLKLIINGGASGARGSVSFSQGFAAQLNQTLTQLTGSAGIVAASTDGANASVKDIDAQRTAFSAHLATVQAQYQAQFTALDTLISSMNSTSTFLTQQLASLPKITINGS